MPEPDIYRAPDGTEWPSLTLIYHGGPLDGHREHWPHGLRQPDARLHEVFAYREHKTTWRYVMQFLVDGSGLDVLAGEVHYTLERIDSSADTI